MHEKKHRIPTHVLYKIFIYVALIALAISIIVPVAWVFMASLKKNAEFIGADVNPWALPKQFYYQNFVVAFQDARMGDFFLNSFIVTALALALLLILALPASYVNANKSISYANKTVIFYFCKTVHFSIYSLMVECIQFHREESLYAA